MKVKFSRCSSNNLASVPQVDGQLIYTKDTGDVYLDVGNQRHKVSNFIIENRKENIVNPSLEKLYFITNESKLYKFVGNDVETGNPIWLNISGASEDYVDTKSQETKTYVDNNFLKKDNTTAYTPTQQYHPATKEYVDMYAVTSKPFPNTFITNRTTADFLDSIEVQHLPSGMTYLGQVRLSDMPSGVTVQAEVEVYTYPQNVIYCIMRSAEVSPYHWECNSYDFRGWEGIDKTANAYTDSCVENALNYADNVGSETLTNANEYTDIEVQGAKDYTDNKIGNINTILDEINGVEV